MDKLPDKPERSAIEQDADAGGIALRWRQPAAGFLHYGFAVQYAVLFSIWTAGCTAGIVSVFVQPFGLFSCCTIVVLCVLIYAGAALAFALWFLLAPDRPASLRLEAEGLRYDPGRSKVVALQLLFEKRPPPKSDPIAAQRSEIGGFVLERAGERRRLCLDRGANRLEIGPGLREPDREWLFAVLQAWRTPNEARRQPAAPPLLPAVGPGG